MVIPDFIEIYNFIKSLRIFFTVGRPFQGHDCQYRQTFPSNQVMADTPGRGYGSVQRPPRRGESAVPCGFQRPFARNIVESGDRSELPQRMGSRILTISTNE